MKNTPGHHVAIGCCECVAVVDNVRRHGIGGAGVARAVEIGRAG